MKVVLVCYDLNCEDYSVQEIDWVQLQVDAYNKASSDWGECVHYTDVSIHAFTEKEWAVYSKDEYNYVGGNPIDPWFDEANEIFT